MNDLPPRRPGGEEDHSADPARDESSTLPITDFHDDGLYLDDLELELPDFEIEIEEERPTARTRPSLSNAIGGLMRGAYQKVESVLRGQSATSLDRTISRAEQSIGRFFNKPLPTAENQDSYRRRSTPGALLMTGRGLVFTTSAATLFALVSIFNGVSDYIGSMGEHSADRSFINQLANENRVLREQLDATLNALAEKQRKPDQAAEAAESTAE